MRGQRPRRHRVKRRSRQRRYLRRLAMREIPSIFDVLDAKMTAAYETMREITDRAVAAYLALTPEEQAAADLRALEYLATGSTER